MCERVHVCMHLLYCGVLAPPLFLDFEIIAALLKNSALARMLNGFVSGRGNWLGCSQLSGSTHMNRGWSWIDGTPASNMNCGAPDASGCGIWSIDYPK